MGDGVKKWCVRFVDGNHADIEAVGWSVFFDGLLVFYRDADEPTTSVVLMVGLANLASAEPIGDGGLLGESRPTGDA